MKKRNMTTSLIAISLIAGNAFAQDKPTPYVTDAEYAELIELLDTAQDTMMGLITGLTDEQWSFKQNPDRWSVGECVEHISRSEAALIETIKRILETPADPEWYTRTQGKTALLRQAIPNRNPQGQGGASAPEEIRPTEDWDRETAIKNFYTTHGQARAYIETMNRNIKDRTQESAIPVFGWLNAYDWLNIIPLHVVRHSKQIAEVQADPNYPKKKIAAAVEHPDPNITDEEFATLIADIDRGQEVLLGLISGVTEEQWEFRENPNRWSMAECVEHITRTERAILDGLNFAFQGPPNPNWFEETGAKYDLVRKSVLTRNPGGAGSTFSAPGEVAPTQDWDRARGFQEFYITHGLFRAYVETMPRDIKSRTLMNPFPEIGLLNGHEWLTLTALHVLRHSKQIAEIKADPNYPK